MQICGSVKVKVKVGLVTLVLLDRSGMQRDHAVTRSNGVANACARDIEDPIRPWDTD